jgi:acyl-CoA thioesterase
MSERTFDADHGPGSHADAYGRLLGLRTLEARPGLARVELEVGPSHLNDLGIVHGGAIFSLADQALALASNLHGQTTVLSGATIHFLRSASLGDRLLGTAHEERRGQTLSLYTVRVTRGEELIALASGQMAAAGLARNP